MKFSIVGGIVAPSKFGDGNYVNLGIVIQHNGKRELASLQSSDPGVMSLSEYVGHEFEIADDAMSVTEVLVPNKDKTATVRKLNASLTKDAEIRYVGEAIPPKVTVVGLPK